MPQVKSSESPRVKPRTVYNGKAIGIFSSTSGGPPGPGGGGGTAPAVALGTNGKVSTSGQNVTWISGDQFSTTWAPGTKIMIGGAEYTIQSVTDPTHLTVQENTLPTLSSAWYAVGTEIIVRNNDLVEVDVYYDVPGASSTNWKAAAVYVEDPDISSSPAAAMDGTTTLDGTTQMSGEWSPFRDKDSVSSPAAELLPVMGVDRDVRIYLASFGPNSSPILVRANDPDNTPTPSVVVTIKAGGDAYVSGMEHAWLVTNVAATPTYEYDQVPPLYTLTFQYQPPSAELEAHRPPGINPFGGVAIWYKYPDGTLKEYGEFSYIQPANPVGGSLVVWTSTEYQANKGSFRVYFVSADTAGHQNTIVDGVTPYADVTIDPTVPAPDVTGFTIDPPTYEWQMDGSFVEMAMAHWKVPKASADGKLYAGVYLYKVAVQGTPPFSTVPLALTAQLALVDENYPLEISNIPATAEVWTIAAISVDFNGTLADDPNTYGQPGNTFHSPTATLTVQAPTPGSPGSGQEYAPSVTINANPTVTATESLSSDGVGMVSFTLGSWTEPASNQFGHVRVGMVINNDPTHPVFWDVPKGTTTFTTPKMPSFGNIGSSVPVDFYLVSVDPQEHSNQLVATGANATPHIHFSYTPTEGAVIPARSGWFSSEFAWPAGGSFQAESFAASKVFVGSQLVVGGSVLSSFGASQNGQIAVLDSSGKLLDWLGEQLPSQRPAGQTGPPLWGAWLGQVWIGGTNPLDAPVFVDNQGIIEVGGIAAAKGSQYPYISVRDASGYEKGRIGASLTAPSGPQDGVGSSPPSNLTAGAWFTQLAVGGSNLSNWNLLITPDATHPLGSLFQMRNINTLTIDYSASDTPKFENSYQLLLGSDVWDGIGPSYYVFPGLRIFEKENQNLFGITVLNRGIVLRGTGVQNYNVLGSLVMYNGTDTGSDIPKDKFWCELAMYSPTLPNNRTVYLSSGNPTSGNASFSLADVNGAGQFVVNVNGDVLMKGILQGITAGTPVNVIALNVGGVPVIDSGGNWKGQPISGGGGTSGQPQSPWASNIDAANFDLNNIHNITSKHSTYILTDNAGGITPGLGIYAGNGIIIGGAGNTLPAMNLQATTFKLVDTGSVTRIYLDNTGTMETRSASNAVIFSFSDQLYQGAGKQVLIDTTGAWVGPMSPANITMRSGNVVVSAGAPIPSGSGYVVADHIGSVNEIGAQYANVSLGYQISGAWAINSGNQFVGSGGVNTPGADITGSRLLSNSLWIGGVQTIDASRTGTFGTINGSSLSISGATTFSGGVTVPSLSISPNILAINSFGHFVGPGAEIRGGNLIVSPSIAQFGGSGNISADHIGATFEIGATNFQVGGHIFIDSSSQEFNGRGLVTTYGRVIDNAGTFYGATLWISGYQVIDSSRNFSNVNQISMGLSNALFVDSGRNVTAASLNMIGGNITQANEVQASGLRIGGVLCATGAGVWIGSLPSSLSVSNLSYSSNITASGYPYNGGVILNNIGQTNFYSLTIKGDTVYDSARLYCGSANQGQGTYFCWWSAIGNYAQGVTTTFRTGDNRTAQVVGGIIVQIV